MLYKNVLKDLPLTPLSRMKMDKMQYLAVSRIEKTEKCGKVLIVDIYQRKQPRELLLRFFSDKKSYQVYDAKKDEWTKKLIYTTLGGRSSSYCYGYVEQRYEIAASDITVEMVKGFLGEKDYQGDSIIHCIDKFVRKFALEQRERAQERKEERLNARMAMFPELPKDFKQYLSADVFPHYAFMDKKIKGKKYGVCSRCGKRFEIKGNVRHKDDIECPKCHTTIIAFEKRYIDSIKDKATVCVTHKIDDKFMFRWIKVCFEWYIDGAGKYKTLLKTDEYYRMLNLFDRGTRKTLSFSNKFAYPYGKYWREHINESCNDLAYVYPNNLQEIFGENYCNVNLQETLKKNQQPLKFLKLLDNLKKFPPAEYLFKMGMYRLASELGKDDLAEGDSFSTILGVNPQYKKWYALWNVSNDEHYVIKSAREWVSNDDFIKLRKLIRRTTNIIPMCNILYASMSVKKFVNYFTAQKKKYSRETFDQVMTWYNDYISMSEQMEVDLSHKSVRYPKDIKKAHDHLVKAYKAVEDEKLEQQMKKATENLYNGLTEYKDNKYAIVFPRTRAEFITEGQSLSHCVGTQKSYFNNHISGEKMIFFIRRAEDIKTPFVTMQIDMQRLVIMQIYGYGDKRPKPPVISFANKFLTLLKKDTEVRRVS